jgi:predicted Zn-dependent protease
MDSALAEYTVALRLDPFLVPAHLNRAMVLVLKGQFAEANRQLEWVVRENPDVALVHVFHGAVGLLQGRYADATASYQAALALVPTHAEARIGLAAALLDAGDPGAAANEADRLSAPDAQSAFVTAGRDYILGRIDLARGDAAAAVERLRKATELAPHIRYTGVSFWEALVKAYLEIDQPTEALRALETGLEVEPYYMPHLYWFGRALEMEGDEEGAAEAYRRFLDAWRDADADAPFLSEAHARLSVLDSRRS